MERVKLLDCTLRDGGFTNDWNFGQGTIQSIISRLDSAGIDVIELGFIDQRRSYDPNRSIVPDSLSFMPLIEGLNLRHAKLAAMIDYGTYDLERVAPCEQTHIDIIRVIFKKKDIDGALRYCAAVQSKGYAVSVQPVSVTGYSDAEFVELIEKINGIRPYAVSIVDTYGLMQNAEVRRYFELLERHLDSACSIGFHAHNNFQMAYANCIALWQGSSQRNIILDGSLFGMGKGAGNAPIELLAQYFNENCGGSYRVNQLLEAIDVDVMKEYAKSPWGYSLKYFIAASNDCHPNYVGTLMEKKNLSVQSINEILSQIPAASKLTYDGELLAQLYDDYQNHEVDDGATYRALEEQLGGRTLVLLAPGHSLETYKQKIIDHIASSDAVVISINFLHEAFPIDYVFMGNPKRYSQFYHKMYGTQRKSIPVICTSNITGASYAIDYPLNYAELKFSDAPIRDNPMLMLLRALSKMRGLGRIVIAGFDGYVANASSNYYNQYLELLYCPDDVMQRNELIKREMRKFQQSLHIEFLTPSLYCD